MMADGKTPKVTFGLRAHQDHLHCAPPAPPDRRAARWSACCCRPSVGGALTNYALMLLGRVPVNLNYTSSSEVIASCAQPMRRRCGHHLEGIRRALSQPRHSRPHRCFLKTHWLLRASREKLPALAFAWLASTALLRRRTRAQARELASPVFPADDRKASPVDRPGHGHLLQRQHRRSQGRHAHALQHHVQHQQVSQVFMLDGRDKILGILPFFHSFGFMAALWMPAVNGVGVVYHPNPLDAQGHRRTGREVQRNLPHRHANISASLHAALFAGELRQPAIRAGRRGKAAPSASRLPSKTPSASALSRAMAARSVRPWSPSMGATSALRDSARSGARRGKIGHPLPGVSVRVVDLDTGEPVAPGTRACCW